MQNPDAAIAEAIKVQSVGNDVGLQATTVMLPPDVLEFLRDTAKKRGVSTGDMLRMALGTQKFLTEAVNSGSKVLISGKNGTKDVAI
ncbi:hypothetical protein [Sphingomonas sp. Leaf343]|uniref:hypothetical protein n=1 Tax=Sphingomonas sp. Leaf343 TaxID=1736345 RepID=UPI000A88D01B|nr:hypothetical protein [Sphingomonas sp. Leaf343]